MSDDRIDALVEELRSAFDASFARAATVAGVERELMVAIGVAGVRHALRPKELAGLARAGSIVPLPGAVRGRVGLTSMQGVLVPVYALSTFLGLPPEPVRWLAVRSAGAPVALGFGELDGSIEVESSKLDAGGVGPHISSVLDDRGGRRLVVDVVSIVSEIASACRGGSLEV